ncbi:MAG: sulfatase [Verrucomicrobiales bacterium VVV1]|nr:MAG: sulfatase [Verrucomicrobiales bacterium VVV1]
MKLLLTALLAPVSMLMAADAAKPNILFIVGDDMGYADVGFHQCKDIPTPSLDSLAASGARFTNGYVSGPYCSPTRAGLLTGRYQTRFGHEFNPGGGNQGLPLTETTIADRLKAAGYATGIVGKWHLGSQPEMHPQKRGFEEFFGFLGGAHSYFNTTGILRGGTQVAEKEYTTDAFGREAVEFIERHKAKPWFLYLAFNAVHTPMDATDDRLAKFPNVAEKQRKTYDAMMLAMDEAIGKVRQKLVDSHLDGNTLIVFISDNGGPTMRGVTVNGSSNLPLRGSKRTTLEGGIRVPFLISWPGHVKPAVLNQPVIQLDLTATALAAAGVEIKPEWKQDGTNLLPYLDGGKTGAPHDALYWRFGQQMAIRAGDFKLVRYDSNADTQTGAGGQPVTPAKLYNLADDLGETKDLAAAQPEKVAELQAKWNAWNQENVNPLWGGRGDSDGDEPDAAPKKRKRAKE